MIIYHLEEAAAKAGKTVWDIRKNKIIGNSALEKIKNNDGSVGLSTLYKLCKYLECFPEDIVEFKFEEGQE